MYALAGCMLQLACMVQHNLHERLRCPETGPPSKCLHEVQMRAKAAGVAFEGCRAMHSTVASLNSAMSGCQASKLYLPWPTDRLLVIWTVS